MSITNEPDIIPPTPEEDAEIIEAALADPDAPPLTDDQLAHMVPSYQLAHHWRIDVYTETRV